MWWDIQAHVQENLVVYAVGAAILLPAIIFSRKYLMNYLWWPSEFLVYVASFHFLVKSIIFCAAWFKQNTRMYWEDRIRPDWSTPLYQIWNPDLFNPRWVFYLEITVFVLILYFMVRYRPMVIQKRGPVRQHISKGRAAQVRPPGAPRPHARGR
jgi:hypothetical protein